jgi:hypothetical protein
MNLFEPGKGVHRLVATQPEIEGLSPREPCLRVVVRAVTFLLERRESDCDIGRLLRKSMERPAGSGFDELVEPVFCLGVAQIPIDLDPSALGAGPLLRPTSWSAAIAQTAWNNA